MRRLRGWLPSRAQLRGGVPYLAAGALYVPLGVWDPRLLLSWTEGIVVVFAVVWVIPVLVRRRPR